MTDEGHRQKDEADGAPSAGATDAGTTDDRIAVQDIAGGADDDAAVRNAHAEGNDAAAREPGLADSETISTKSEAAGGKVADHESGSDEAPPGSEPPESPESPESTWAPAASLEDELTEARRAASENLDRALRAQADLENVRRRMERDLQNAHKFALDRFVSELLPVKDSLELGLAASTERGASAASIVEGVELTLRMLEQAMEKFGVKAVDPGGEAFDPEFHQAITLQESDTAESGAVLTVVQKGYLLNERLVRPAMVIVAK